MRISPQPGCRRRRLRAARHGPVAGTAGRRNRCASKVRGAGAPARRQAAHTRPRTRRPATSRARRQPQCHLPCSPCTPAAGAGGAAATRAPVVGRSACCAGRIITTGQLPAAVRTARPLGGAERPTTLARLMLARAYWLICGWPVGHSIRRAAHPCGRRTVPLPQPRSGSSAVGRAVGTPSACARTRI